MRVARAYDALNRAIFLPSGGSGRLRRTFVEVLDVKHGQRVLELGCGTGQATAPLLAAGAAVVAVDRLSVMLDRARRRAPSATFVEGDVMDADVGEAFDRAALSFLLHNFDSSDRTRLLRRTADALTAEGRIGILDWALPDGSVRSRAWSWFIGRIEPSQTARRMLETGLFRDVHAAGLSVEDRRRLAGGRVELLIVSEAQRSTS